MTILDHTQHEISLLSALPVDTKWMIMTLIVALGTIVVRAIGLIAMPWGELLSVVSIIGTASSAVVTWCYDGGRHWTRHK